LDEIRNHAGVNPGRLVQDAIEVDRTTPDDRMDDRPAGLDRLCGNAGDSDCANHRDLKCAADLSSDCGQLPTF